MSTPSATVTPPAAADEEYAICAAKTEFREGINTGDVERTLGVFADEFVDMSEGQPSFFGADSKPVLRHRLRPMFARFRATLYVTIIMVRVMGDTALELGWHELLFEPKNGNTGGEIQKQRYRYLETWQKDAGGAWKITLFINNVDQPPQLPPAT
jgi:ketosteroid isomerase-like protein